LLSFSEGDQKQTFRFRKVFLGMQVSRAVWPRWRPHLLVRSAGQPSRLFHHRQCQNARFFKFPWIQGGLPGAWGKSFKKRKTETPLL